MCCKMFKTKFISTSSTDRSMHYKLKHKFNKPRLNLHHQFPKIQNKPQKQSALPEKKRKNMPSAYTKPKTSGC